MSDTCTGVIERLSAAPSQALESRG